MYFVLTFIFTHQSVAKIGEDKKLNFSNDLGAGGSGRLLSLDLDEISDRITFRCFPLSRFDVERSGFAILLTEVIITRTVSEPLFEDALN